MSAPRRRPEDSGWTVEDLRSAWAADGSGPFRYAPDGSGPYSYDPDGSGPWLVEAPRRRRPWSVVGSGALALAVVVGSVALIATPLGATLGV
ncbi:hypothetical protein [Curtobacterium sp. MCBA15_001]|uniref:hypothetical protein n=1 Tax=Curtobacterium sp. MCBA15_001 TaxID=1898731 RepID=UPI0008DE0A6F|nr:hypothetical protein [Curtobacterium sp. MCBA15_001]OIH95510.1 hypothetical protein BIU90_02080 [Curtobacterium sp. MCBA15_001]